MMEFRQFDITLEENQEEERQGLFLRGYVNKTGQESQVLRSAQGKFVEKIQKGCFKRAIESASKIDLLFNHDVNNLLGSTKNNSLRLVEDEIGLRFECELVPTTLGRDVYEMVRSGLIDGMSFGFSNPTSNWTMRSDGIYSREITNMELKEVSIVRNPAYLDSEVGTRSDQPETNELDSFLVQQNALKERLSKF